MQFEIKGDRLYIDGRPARFVESPNQGGRIEPTGILYHDTADRVNPEDSVNWFLNPKSKVSAHFVIGRDASITQMVECDRAAWHAGASSWQGRSGCNGFMIGIEIDNPGRLTPRGEKAYAWFGDSWPLEDCEVTNTSNKTHGAGAWLPYTEAQLAAVEALTLALLAAYPSIKTNAGHYEVSPGRKVDPGPQFPMARMRATLDLRAPPDRELVAALQGQLVGLGYAAGDVDGVIGPRTRSAIRTFQEQNRLAVTGEFDAATLTALASGNAKEMPLAHREGMTVDDVAALGSSTIRLTGTVKKVATSAAIALGVSSSAAEAPEPPAVSLDALPDPEVIIAAGEKSRNLSDRAFDLVQWMQTPRGITTICILAGLAFVWWLAKRVEVRRVLKARLGIA